MLSFYNTTAEAGQLLLDFTEKAKADEKIVLEFFQKHPLGAFTSYEVWKATGIECKDSCKRAMSVLSHPKKRLLIKTADKVTGPWGRPNCKYRLA